jgi:hypothetical protein
MGCRTMVRHADTLSARVPRRLPRHVVREDHGKSAVIADELTTEEAAASWDSRHRSRDEITSGGDVRFDRASNELFYALRLGVAAAGARATRRTRWNACDCWTPTAGRAGSAGHWAASGTRSTGTTAAPGPRDFCRSESATERHTVSPLRTWSAGGSTTWSCRRRALSPARRRASGQSRCSTSPLSCGSLGGSWCPTGTLTASSCWVAPAVSVAPGLPRSPRRARVAPRRLHAVRGS